MGSPKPGATRRPDRGAAPGSNRHAISAVAQAKDVTSEDSPVPMVCVRTQRTTAPSELTGDIRGLFIRRLTACHVSLNCCLVLPGPRAARSPALVLYRFRRLRGCVRVQVPAARDNRPVRVVELIDERDAGRDVQLRDRLVADPVQVLDQRAQRVVRIRSSNGSVVLA
jgi:hypothetical protein